MIGLPPGVTTTWSPVTEMPLVLLISAAIRSRSSGKPGEGP